MEPLPEREAERVESVAAVMARVVPAPRFREPEPRAAPEFTRREPAEMVRGPEPEFGPERKRAPGPVLTKPAEPERGPEREREVPLTWKEAGVVESAMGPAKVLTPVETRREPAWRSRGSAVE